MKRLSFCLPILCAFFAFSAFSAETKALADETQKVLIGTQTYQCDINPQLSCKAINNVQQKEILIKKNGGKIQIADAPKGLSADIDTTFENSQMSYDITLCSKTVCTTSNSNGGQNGYINQTMFGQYNITEKTFFVLGFFINSENHPVNLEEHFFNQSMFMKKNE
jgi:hypothetical protein